MKKTFSLLCLGLIVISTFAQKSYRDKFQEANYLMEENNYKVALPIWLELLGEDSSNANVNYNVGLCMINSSDNQSKASSLPYFKVASERTDANYDPFSVNEKNAPVYAFHYLGIAQHLNYQFDEAIANFETFDSKITDKNYLYEANKRRIEQAKYAKYSVAHPVNIEITNLGDQLNSEYPDYSPVVRIDESAIYYTSRRLLEDSSNIDFKEYEDGMYYEDIYVSYNDDDKWTKPERLNINSAGHEATINLSIDGRTLYIYKDDNGDGNLYYSNLESDSAGYEVWSTPKKFGPNINSKAYETHVAVTPDGKQLYYVSDREGGYGGKDIYFCNLLPTGTWAAPQNAGPTINTSGDEDGVFIHPDGVTMYFSSNGHSSIGGYDIFRSEYDEDSSYWAKPENLGYPINSVDDDVFFVTTPDGKRGYFSSFKEKGYGDKDIYVIELKDAKETGLTLYTGEFTFVDRMVPPEGAQVIITDNTNGELVGIYTPRQRDGKFSAILKPNRSYHLVYEADEYQPYEEDIFVSDDNIYQEIYKAIRLKPVRVGRGGELIAGDKQNVSGVLMVNNEVAKGVSIDLLGMDKNLLNSSTTDDAGVFNFANLDPDSMYFIRINSDDPSVLAQNSIVIMNDNGEELLFNKIGDGLYQFTPRLAKERPIYKESIKGYASKNGLPLKGVNVKLYNQDDELIGYTTTDNAGTFNFVELNSNERHLIIFDVEDDQLPTSDEILLTNSKGEVLRFKQIRKDAFEFIPDSRKEAVYVTNALGLLTIDNKPAADVNVRLLRDDKSLISETTTDEVGSFNFFNLTTDKVYYIEFDKYNGEYPKSTEIILTNSDGEPMEFKKIKDGLYQFTPSVSTNIGLAYTIGPDGKRVYETKFYNLEARDGIDYPESYPTAEELEGVIVYFQKFFTYNVKDINENNKQFLLFANDIAELVRQRGYADIIITSSASKVPTKTWKKNSIISSKRAYDTKALLERVMLKRGLQPDQYNFVDINTLITGPEYKGDYLTNKKVYEKHQYVRVFIK